MSDPTDTDTLGDRPGDLGASLDDAPAGKVALLCPACPFVGYSEFNMLSHTFAHTMGENFGKTRIKTLIEKTGKSPRISLLDAFSTSKIFLEVSSLKETTIADEFNFIIYY